MDLTFPGTVVDRRGTDPVRWRVRSALRGRTCDLAVSLEVRGITLTGWDITGLEPVAGTDPAALAASGLVIDEWGEVVDCVLTGSLPCLLHDGVGDREVEIGFALDRHRDLVPQRYPPRSPVDRVTLTLTLDGVPLHASDLDFEDAMTALERDLPHGAGLVCCSTCRLGDYSPDGHTTAGMECYRDAAPRYRDLTRPRGRAIAALEPTQRVLETHRCGRYIRIGQPL